MLSSYPMSSPWKGSKVSMKSRLGCRGISPGWIMSAFPRCAVRIRKETEESFCFLRQHCRNTLKAWNGSSWPCSHSRLFQGEVQVAGWNFYLLVGWWLFSTLRRQERKKESFYKVKCQGTDTPRMQRSPVLLVCGLFPEVLTGCLNAAR